MNNNITLNKERYDNFFSNYEPVNGIVCNQQTKTFYENGENYLCRFCGKRKPEVKFSNDAHIIPQLLGNQYLLSKFECDSCNALFGKYEEALSYCVGPFTSFMKVGNRNRKGAPKFKDQNSGIEIFSENEKIHIHSNKPVVDEKNMTAKIVVNKYSYIPLNVYKCLLKIGISLVNANELLKYGQSLLFLNSNKYDRNLKELRLFRMFAYFVQGPLFPKPAAFLFKRKNSNSRKYIPKHTLLLYFPNHMYQIFLPFYLDDIVPNIQTINYELSIAPIFDRELFPECTNYKCFDIDLSSCEKKIKEPHEINLKLLTLDINKSA